MKKSDFSKRRIFVGVVDSDPLRFARFQALLDSYEDLQLASLPLSEIDAASSVDVVLLGKSHCQNSSEVMQHLNVIRPDLRVIVVASGKDNDAIVDALAHGAKGYVDEAAAAAEFVNAVRTVGQGLIWASRQVLALFIDRSSKDRQKQMGRKHFTIREKQVLEMLVRGKSNKEIAFPLGIVERTVKAHVAKLLQKVGVPNRVLLSVRALDQSLVSFE
jgi:DNA-binding NarL/FixJ family response regulator